MHPKILGIVNITQDSFSDGGLYFETADAIKHALKLLQDGADILDLGPASSNPDSSPVSPEEEIHRLTPIIERLKREPALISIDSFQLETQRYGIEKKVDFLNDIQGFPQLEFYHELSDSNCRLILMHSIQRFGKANRRPTNPDTIFTEILNFFDQRLDALSKAGINRDRIILDPGMGFFLGSNPEPSVVMLKKIRALKEQFNLPVLISVSRKSFLRKITGRDVKDIAPATLSAELFAAFNGVDYVRTHDVRQLKDALAIWQALEC